MNRKIVINSDKSIIHTNALRGDTGGIIIAYFDTEPTGYIVYSSESDIWFYHNVLDIDNIPIAEASLENIMFELEERNIANNFELITFEANE